MIRTFLLTLLASLVVACDGISTSQDPVRSITSDTTVLAGDTLQRIVTSHWKDDALESRDTVVTPVTNFIWLSNRYGDTVLAEAWSGTSLEWRNGTVLGYDLTALPNPDLRKVPLPPGGLRRLAGRREKELLVLVGLPSASSAVLLCARRFTEAHPGDTIVLDTQGLLVLK